MVDLILRPSTIDPKNSFALQLRFHESLGETEYYTLCRISAGIADDIVRAGAPDFLFDEPEDNGVNLKDEITALRTRCEKADADLKYESDRGDEWFEKATYEVGGAPQLWSDRATAAESRCEELDRRIAETRAAALEEAITAVRDKIPLPITADGPKASEVHARWGGFRNGIVKAIDTIIDLKSDGPALQAEPCDPAKDRRIAELEAALGRLASMEGMTGSFYRKDNAEGLELLARLKFAEAAIRALIQKEE